MNIMMDYFVGLIVLRLQALLAALRTALIRASLKARNSALVISPEAMANSRWAPPVTGRRSVR